MLLVYFASYFALVSAGGEHRGIVTGVMENGNSWGEEGKKAYTYYMECDYQRFFDYEGNEKPYTFDLKCLKFEGESDFIVSINYDNNVFDNFNVMTCNKDDVINSIFPPEGGFEEDNKERPTAVYLQYIDDKGECWARKYKFENRMSKAAQRFEPDKIDCPGLDGWERYGRVAKFSNCKIATKEVSKTVKGYASDPDEIQWFPGLFGVAPSFRRKLECDYDKFSKLYRMICVKLEDEDKYLAFVMFTIWKPFATERFTVTSCNENDIVNGIFPQLYSTAHPSTLPNYYRKLSWSQDNGKCYQSYYEHYYNNKALMGRVKEIPCPSKDDDWTNPSFGFVGQWGHCVENTGAEVESGQQEKRRQTSGGGGDDDDLSS